MSGSPQLKVFDPSGKYVAACKFAEDAAVLCAGYGEGAEVRLGHSKKDRIWLEGSEDESADESIDGAATIIHQRVLERRAAARRALLERAN